MKIQRLKKKNLALIIILVLFLIESYFFAFLTRKIIAPDENYHVRVSQYHSTSFNPFIKNTPKNYIDGNIENIPFLYHYTNGLLLKLNPGIDDTLYLRLFNPLIALSSLAILYKIVLELTKSNRKIATATVFLMANTLMFVFLSGMVNYDNLLILLSHLCIYALVKAYKTQNLNYSILSCAFALLGNLTVFMFLPISAFAAIANLWILVKYRNKFASNLKSTNKALLMLIGIAFLLCVGLCIKIYGVNLVKYHSIKPDCRTLLTHEQCLQNYPYRRNFEYREQAKNLETSLNLPEYLLKWSYQMTRGIFGLTLHNVRYFNYPAFVALVVMAILFIKNIRKELLRKDFVTLLALFSAAYICILLAYNYREYLTYKIDWMAVQGRYIFPIIGFVYLYVVRAIYQDYKQIYYKIMLTSAFVLMFIANISFLIFGPMDKIISLF